MDSEGGERTVHPFKAEELNAENSPSLSLREQFGQLKLKCAASLCILCILLFEVITRQIEHNASTSAILQSNWTESENGSTIQNPLLNDCCFTEQ